MVNSRATAGRRFGFWQKWMVAVSIIGILMGLLMAFGSTGIFFKNYNRALAQAFWAQPQLHQAVAQYHPWIFTVLGSSIMGWCVCFLFLSFYPFKRRERWVYYCFIASLAVWAPLDSAMSIFYGIGVEALFKLGAALGFAIPLAATFRDFFPRNARNPAV